MPNDIPGRRIFFILCLFLAACSVKPLSFDAGNAKWGADVTWHGHSCFTLRDSLGRVIVIDPFDETVGYGRLNLRADGLLITHEHFDHNNLRSVRTQHAEADLVRSTGTSVVASGLIVTGIASDHDDNGGEINGSNRIYCFTMGGLRFAHLGDFGQAKLTEYQRKLIGPVDVLFIPVGGVVTINAKEAKQIVDQLRPGAVFPMHYGDIRFAKLDDVQLFLNLFPAGQIRKIKDSHIRIRQADLGEVPLVYTLLPTNKN